MPDISCVLKDLHLPLFWPDVEGRTLIGWANKIVGNLGSFPLV